RRFGGPACERHAEREDRAALRRILDPDAAALSFDDATRREESDARPRDLVVAGAARVGLEDPRALVRRHPATLVLDAHDRAIVGALDLHGDARPLRRVLRRVVHEPRNDFRGPPPIAAHEDWLPRAG